MESGPARAAVFAACCDCVNLLTMSGVLGSWKGDIPSTGRQSDTRPSCAPHVGGVVLPRGLLPSNARLLLVACAAATPRLRVFCERLPPPSRLQSIGVTTSLSSQILPTLSVSTRASQSKRYSSRVSRVALTSRNCCTNLQDLARRSVRELTNVLSGSPQPEAVRDWLAAASFLGLEKNGEYVYVGGETAARRKMNVATRAAQHDDREMRFRVHPAFRPFLEITDDDLHL